MFLKTFFIQAKSKMLMMMVDFLNFLVGLSLHFIFWPAGSSFDKGLTEIMV